VRAVLRARQGRPLVNGYGPTENTTFTTCYVMTDPAQVGPTVPIGQPKDLGEASVQVIHLQLHVPVAAVGIEVGDTVTVTASTLDPDLVGRVFNIRSVAHKTFLTARRMDIQEVES